MNFLTIMHLLFYGILTYLSILPCGLSILLKVPTNTSGYGRTRRPSFTGNVAYGLRRAQEISRSSTPLLILEVSNTVRPGSQGSTSLDKFLRISIDVLVTQSPLLPYMNQRATLYGSANRWGSWGLNLLNLRDVDAATASRAFGLNQIVMDEVDAHQILRMIGFWGPWDCIYLCKLPPSGPLFYIFQQPEVDSGQNSYQMVELDTGLVRFYRGTVRQPCSNLELDLTATVQAGSMNRTDLPASPSPLTNLTSQNVFEVDSALRDNITAS